MGDVLPAAIPIRLSILAAGTAAICALGAPRSSPAHVRVTRPFCLGWAGDSNEHRVWVKGLCGDERCHLRGGNYKMGRGAWVPHRNQQQHYDDLSCHSPFPPAPPPDPPIPPSLLILHAWLPSPHPSPLRITVPRHVTRMAQSFGHSYCLARPRLFFHLLIQTGLHPN